MAQLEELIELIMAAKIAEKNSGRRCPKCQEKEGDLIVLPTRLSITGYIGKNKISEKEKLKIDIEVPPLPNFAQKMVSDLPLEYSNYCIQMLREGYLYVLEDKKNGEKKWRVFTSSPVGCLIEHNDINNIPNIPPKYNCNVDTDGADASYISFKNSKDIFKIYFIFSPNKISKASLAFYQTSPEFELQGLTPDQIRSGQKSIKGEDLMSQILEFSTSLKIGEQNSFLHSKIPWDFKLGERSKAEHQKYLTVEIYKKRTSFNDSDIENYYARYLSLYKKLIKRNGVAIVVNDAIGITQSLNYRRSQVYEVYMKPWLQAKDNEGVSNEHRLIILRQLSAFKESFTSHRIRQLIKQNNSLKNFSRYGMDKVQVPSAVDMSEYERTKVFEKMEENIIKNQTEELSQKELQELYWSRLSQEKIDNFEKEMNDYSQYAEKIAEYRADDYIKWLKSPQLMSALDLYDSTEVLSGIEFKLQMSSCLHGASGSEKTCEVLDNWWLESEITPKNIIMRTYFYNNKSLINDVNEYLKIQQNIEISNASERKGDTPEVDKAIKLLIKITKHINRTTNSTINQLAERGYPIALLSVAFADLARCFLKSVTKKLTQTIQNSLGNLLLASIEKTAHQMYNLGFNINGDTFNVVGKADASMIIEEAKNNFRNADLVNTYTAMIVFVFSAYDTYKKLKNGKWKNSRELAELTTSIIASTAAGFQIVTSAIKYCIGDEESTVAKVVYISYGRIFFWGSSLMMIAGGMSAILDLFDGNKAKEENKVIYLAYYARCFATTLLSISQFLLVLRSLIPWLNNIISNSIKNTIWVHLAKFGVLIAQLVRYERIAIILTALNFYVSFFIIVVSLVIIIFDDNALQKWFDRCCFSKKLANRKKFEDLGEELTEWNKALEVAF
ncbi:hypothetical protein A9G11_09375 [Gilliamella sp. wkB108]|uniref:T6SS effector BTH_I2691 family protein n=1 Tax=Gilliamella sp. wkB108 TaxID=3120256 RepID=UPI00080EDA1B|nr:T6SS effector BTH_I2691 family protein [Gilliamella apicola]OCG20899.1 hypothetical protein A9G11_09375 [Gilliamella apicola]